MSSLRRSTTKRVIANASAAGSALITGPVIARTLGPDGRGEVAAVTAPILLVLLLVTSICTEAVSSQVAATGSSTDESAYPSAAVALCFGFSAAVALNLCLPMLLADRPELRVLSAGLTVIIPIAAVQAAIRGVRQGQLRHNLITREAWGVTAMRLGVILVLAFAGLLSLESTSFALLITLVIPVVFLEPIRFARSTVMPVGFTKRAKSFAAGVARLLPGYAANALTLRLDQLVLIGLTSSSRLGLYVIAVSVAELPVFISSAVRQILLAESAAKRNAGLVARASRTLLILLLMTAVVGAILVDPFIHFFFGPDFAQAAPVARVLLLATVVGAPMGTLSAGLIAFGRTSKATIGFIAGFCSNAALLPLLILEFGILGAAWASVIAYAFASAVMAVIFSKVSSVTVGECLIPRIADVSYFYRTIASRS